MFIKCVMSACLPLRPMLCMTLCSSSSNTWNLLLPLCFGLPDWLLRAAGCRDEEVPLTARVLLKNCWVWEGEGEGWLELDAALLELGAAFDAGGWLILGDVPVARFGIGWPAH